MDSYSGMARLVLLVIVHLVLCFLPFLEALGQLLGPSFLAATLPFSSPEEYSYVEFSGRTYGNVPVFCAFCYDSGYPLRQLRSLFGYRDRYKLCPVLVSARSHLFPMMKWPRSSSTKVVGWFCSVRCTSCCIGISRCILFVCRQAQDLRHRVRCGLETLHQPVETPQVQFLDKVLDMPIAVLRQVLRSMVQKTVVVTQWQSIEGRRHSFRAAEAHPHGPGCSADHGDSAVAAHFGGRCPCCAVAQILSCCRGEDLGAPTVAAR